MTKGYSRFKTPPLKLLVITCAISFVSMSNEAYQSILNQPAPILKRFVNDSVYSHYGVTLDRTSLETLWGALVATLDVGAVLGSLLIGVTAERIGRRDTVLLLNPILMVASALFQFLAYYTNAFELILLGRFLIGVNLTLATVISLYLTESCPTYCRGSLGSIPTFFYAAWVTLGTIISMEDFLGRPDTWQFLLAFGVVPALLAVALRFFLPESPKHLFISKRDMVGATSAIEFYHCTSDSRQINKVSSCSILSCLRLSFFPRLKRLLSNGSDA